MKSFVITLPAHEACQACDIPGYSHQVETTIPCSWYPFTRDAIAVHVRATSARSAIRAARFALTTVISIEEARPPCQSAWMARMRKVAARRAERLSWQQAVTPELRRLWRIAGVR